MSFSKKQTSTEIDAIFTGNVIRRFSAGNDYRYVGSVFSLLATFTDRATGYTKKVPNMMVHSAYSAPIVLVINQEMCNRLKATQLISVTGQVAELKILVIKTSQVRCGNELFKVKFHLLDHPMEDLGRFESKKMLDVSPSGRYTVHVERVYRHKLQRLLRSIAEMGR